MDKADLSTELSNYETQLQQILLAIPVTPEGKDKEKLQELAKEFTELISLTKEIANKAADDCNNQEDSLSAEYALFQAEIAELDAPQSPPPTDVPAVDISKDLSELVGMKCQAPFQNSWDSNKSFHNALVVQLGDSEVHSSQQIQVRVMFSHPTHPQMLPCPYYLDEGCKFDDENCRFSHGEVVYLNELRDYREPNFSKISTGSTVLAKHSDKLWHRAIVISMENETYKLRLESSRKEIENHLYDIYPLDGSNDEENEQESDNEEVVSFEEEPKIELAKIVLLAPPSSALGEWERYTTGFGSKLMAQMGYVAGSGLGKHANGRIEPVPVLVFPAGKSLDHCMILKEGAGGSNDLLKAEKKLRRKKLKEERINSKAYEREKQRTDVFTFLNNKLGQSSCENTQTSSTAKETLKTKSSHGLNVTSLQISDDIRKTEKEIKGLKESLNRNNPSSPAYAHLKEKLDSKKGILQHLQSSERKVLNEQEQRKDRKKLAVF